MPSTITIMPSTVIERLWQNKSSKDLSLETALLAKLVETYPDYNFFKANQSYEITHENTTCLINLSEPLFRRKSEKGKWHYQTCTPLGDDEQGAMAETMISSRFKLDGNHNFHRLGKQRNQEYKVHKFVRINDENKKLVSALINEQHVYATIHENTNKKIKRLAIEEYEFSDTSTPYLIFSQDYISGKTGTRLTENAQGYIDNSKLLRHCDLAQFSNLLLNALRSLKTLHDAGYVHADLKLENMIFTENNDVQLIDFGLSDLASNDDAAPRGSPLWLPDEILKQELANTKASDIYGLGLTFIYLYSGPQAMIENEILVYLNASQSDELIYQYKVNENELQCIYKNNPSTERGNIHNLLKAMVNDDPEKRPDVNTCLNTLTEIFPELTKHHDLSAQTSKPITQKVAINPSTSKSTHTHAPHSPTSFIGLGMLLGIGFIAIEPLAVLSFMIIAVAMISLIKEYYYKEPVKKQNVAHPFFKKERAINDQAWKEQLTDIAHQYHSI